MPITEAATAATVLTLMTPSPGAPVVSVTSQSQVVTTYVPQLTLCVLPTVSSYAGNLSTGVGNYLNSSAAIPALGSDCSTQYSPTSTTVCATTLTGVATQYTVSQCDQNITFSSQYGYSLVTPSPTTANATGIWRNTSMITAAPTVHTYTTFWAAPWQALSTIGTTQDIDVEVCDTLDSGAYECVHLKEVWSTGLVTITTTTVLHIELATTIYGPSQLILETFTVDVTEAMTTFSLTTDLVLESPTAIATTSTSTVYPSASSTPYTTETVTVKDASSLTSTAYTTSTTTRRITTTIYSGTATVTAVSTATTAEPIIYATETDPLGP